MKKTVYFCHSEDSIDENLNGVTKLLFNYAASMGDSIEFINASKLRLSFCSLEFLALTVLSPFLLLLTILARSHAVGLIDSCKLSIYLRKHGVPCVVLCFSPKLSFFGLFAQFFLDSKYFSFYLFKIDSMLVYYDSLNHDGIHRRFINKVRILIEILIIRVFDSRYRTVFYVNRRDELRDSIFSRTLLDTIPNGVNTSQVILKNVPTGFLSHEFSFHGDLNYYPNKSSINKFYSVAHALDKIGVIHVYGRGAENFKPSRFIKFHGYVEDINFIFSSNFYLSFISSGAGIKNKALEAMASGIFILATRETFNGIPEAVAGVNYFLIDLSLDLCSQIKDGVTYFQIMSLSERLSYANFNRSIAQCYSWNASAQKLSRLIDQ